MNLISDQPLAASSIIHSCQVISCILLQKQLLHLPVFRHIKQHIGQNTAAIRHIYSLSQNICPEIRAVFSPDPVFYLISSVFLKRAADIAANILPILLKEKLPDLPASIFQNFFMGMSGHFQKFFIHKADGIARFQIPAEDASRQLPNQILYHINCRHIVFFKHTTTAFH